jgi:dTMP kinase
MCAECAAAISVMLILTRSSVFVFHVQGAGMLQSYRKKLRAEPALQTYLYQSSPSSSNAKVQFMAVGKAKLVVLEGIDGSGKTTQAAFLNDYIVNGLGMECLLTAEPTKSKLGLYIRGNLMDLKLNPYTMQLLFTADRAEHVSSEIIPALNKGMWVISDRYYFSTIAYAVLTGLAEKQRDALLAVNRTFIQPDLTVFLDVDPRKQLLGGRGRLEVFERMDLESKIRMREEYARLCAITPNCITVKVDNNKEEVRTLLRSLASELIRKA